MLINNEFEVAQPVDKVWEFFERRARVAACLPGAELTEDLGDDKYDGGVAVRMGPVKLAVRRHGPDRGARRRRQADRHRRLRLRREGPRQRRDEGDRAAQRGSGGGTKVAVDQDLQISGAAAQYGRGMISDVTAVLMKQFADNMQERIERGRARRVRRRRSAPATPAASRSASGPCGWR